MTAYNGTTISYDAKGNPLNWRNASILEWSDDRRLTTFVLPDYSGAAIFEYNAEGQRTMKNSFGEKYTDYFYNGSQLFASGERVYNESGVLTGYDNVLEFFYDEDGRPMAFCYDRTDYYTYLLNLQGDVIAILDSNYNVVVEYTYSAYGEILSITGSLASTIGQINPLRYRGYYYDVETGFYYLNSRYYDPVVGRFLNADDISLLTATPTELTDKNLYAYCDNNPVMRVDVDGQFWDTALDVVSLVVSVVDVVKNPDDPMAWVGLAADVVSLAIPCVTGGGTLVKAFTKADDVVDAVKVADNADELIDATKAANKIHGNSLNSTKETVGYALRKNQTHEIMKYGETTRGTRRYTRKFYRENDVYMDIMEHGSKYEMHFWQHNQIQMYYDIYGKRPPWNKSFW